MLGGDQDIVWPDNLFDIDHLSVDEGAASQTSQGSDGLGRQAERASSSAQPRNASYSASSGAGGEFWDHDDRGMFSNSATITALEDDDVKWGHDKFDLMKIGPPPGLGGTQRFRQSNGGTTGGYEPGRRSPSAIPAGRVQHGQQQTSLQPGNALFNAPGPWGYPSTSTAAQASAHPHPSAGPMPRPSMSHAGSRMTHVPKLTMTEQHNLRQVNQRTDEMAAIMAQIEGQHGRGAAARPQLTGQSQRAVLPIHPTSSARPSMTHLLARPKGLSSLRAPAGSPSPSPSPSCQQATTHQPAANKARKVLPITVPSKTRKVLPITEPSKQPAAAPVKPQAAAQPGSSSKPAQQGSDKPRRFALAIVDPDSQQQVLSGGSDRSVDSPDALSSSQSQIRSGKKALSIVDPGNKQAIELPKREDSAPSRGSTGSAEILAQPVKRTLSIIDPQNKQPVQLPAAELTRTVSNTSAASSDLGKPVKRTLSILDPTNKQAIQLPARPAASSLARSISGMSAASSDSGRPKRTLSIVDPSNKEPVELPAQPIATLSGKSRLASDSNRPQRRPLAIVNPDNKQAIELLRSGSDKVSTPVQVAHSLVNELLSKAVSGDATDTVAEQNVEHDQEQQPSL